MKARVLLFDYGGTLDSDGIPWLDRFLPLYGEAGLDVSPKEFSKAFTRADDTLPSRHRLSGLGLQETLDLQVRCVLETLAPARLDLGPPIAARFLALSREAFRRNLPALKRLRAGGAALGVVSNFYGNLESVLASEGLLEFFDAVADSAVVGTSKPEPALFEHALRRLGARPPEALMVGDSVPRDMKGAEGLGMAHAWLAGRRPAASACCPRAVVLKRLVDLEAALETVPA